MHALHKRLTILSNTLQTNRMFPLCFLLPEQISSANVVTIFPQSLKELWIAKGGTGYALA
jgi:hypothetical protein